MEEGRKNRGADKVNFFKISECKAVKGPVLIPGQRVTEMKCEKLIKIWRETGTLSNFTSRMGPRVLFS